MKSCGILPVMKRTQFAMVFCLMLLSLNVVAAGARKPVTEFEGNYQLSSGTTYKNQEGRDVVCPKSLSLEAEEVRNAKGKLVNATLSVFATSGIVMSFTKVNLGSTWLGGGYFNRASSNKNSISAELGHEWIEPGTPGHPGFPGRPPELRRAVFFRYGVKERGDMLKLWTSGSRNTCDYLSTVL